MVQLEVGVYKDGTKRFELRHLNDLRLAHPDSMAAPAHRPKLGRPTTRPDCPITTEPKTASHNAGSENGGKTSLPQLTDAQPVETQNKQNEIQTSAGKRPARSTRNPNPLYVDALGPPTSPPFLQWSPKPWSASQKEIDLINASLPSRGI